MTFFTASLHPIRALGTDRLGQLPFGPPFRLHPFAVLSKALGSEALALPLAIQSWSLTSLQQRLFKTGGHLIRHARYFILQLAESHLTRRLFGQILGRIERLAWHPT